MTTPKCPSPKNLSYAIAHSMWSRRSLIIAALVAMGGTARAENQWFPQGGSAADPDLLPPIESDVDFPIKPVNPSFIKPRFRRQIVDYMDGDGPNTIVIDPDKRFLFYVLPDNRAIRYGVGVGRAGFEWSGDAEIGLKRKWPRWVPPADMVDRDENAARWANGMPGGPNNPLGARALYLYQFGEDTLYRIHGTNQPSSIGKAMSSGCIRMLNEDVADLYDRVSLGTPVIVLPSEGEY